MKAASRRQELQSGPHRRRTCGIWRWAIGAAALLMSLVPVTPAQAADAKPNLLVILVDDLGYGDLSSFGATDLKTPAIDGLVARGMKLPNFYANCPVCSPTRASLLTGRFPDRVGVPGVIRTHPENSWGYLGPKAVLLPQVLERAGYHSAIVGKWHLGLEAPSRPTDRGFDFFHGYLGDMMDDYYDHRRHGINYMRRNTEEIDPPGHATELFSQWASAYLKERAEASDQPFFLYLAYNAPHTPIQPPDEWYQKVLEREDGIDPKRAKLVALIEHLDEGIGSVLKTLDETGLAENTLVVFSSDNGGQSNVGANNGRARAGKGTMYEGGLRVPTAAVWPGKIEPGSSSDRVLMTMDLFPTLAAASGASFDHPIDGVSFLPTLLGKDDPNYDPDRLLYFTRREGGRAYQGKTIDAVRVGDWKLLQNDPFGPLELYDLASDPLEETNLIERRGDVVRRLSEHWRRCMQAGGAVPWQPPTRRDP